MNDTVHPANFQLVAPFEPAGDQPQAIAKLIDGFESGLAKQTLLGVTGSGKTYTIANVIQAVQKPTLVMAPNKTLAAQLYGEFKAFFPHNAVRSEEHTSELQSLMRISYAVFCLKKKLRHEYFLNLLTPVLPTYYLVDIRILYLLTLIISNATLSFVFILTISYLPFYIQST